MSHTFIITQIAHHVHLVLHQSNERGYDNSRPFHKQRRQLITERLATSCRHEHKCVVAIKKIADDGFLISLKLVKTEVFLQCYC